MATPRYLSSTNTFVPEATGQAIAYVRDQSKFKVNEYVQLVKQTKPVFLWAFLDPDEPIRLVTDQEYDWPDGQPRPKPQGNIGNFKWEEGRCFRRDYGYTVGEQAIETAEGWNPKAFFNAIMLSKAMTNVTKRVITLLETTSGYPTGNTASATTLNGVGNLEGASDDESNAKFLLIKKTFNKIVRRIRLATNGMVSKEDLKVVLAPETADMLSETAELHHYLGQSVHALAQVKGDAPNVNAPWSIPEQIYGLKLVVEDAPIVNIRANADGTVATLETEKIFIKDRTKINFVSRPGGLDGNYGAPSFSTIQRHYYKYEMAVEAWHEVNDKLYQSHVVDQFKELLVAPQAGFCLTGVMA